MTERRAYNEYAKLKYKYNTIITMKICPCLPHKTYKEKYTLTLLDLLGNW